MILVTLGITVVGTNGQITCTVKEERSGEQRYCRFPFIIDRMRYDSCTDFKDPDGKKWCSTRTSNHTVSLHVHVGRERYWGYCPDNCLEKDVGSCNDYAKQGFQCVNPDDCNDMCEIITDGSGPNSPFTVRADQLGCESDKRCMGYNMVCCKNNHLPEMITPTTTETTISASTISTTITATTTTQCINHADQGFQCVPSDQCSDLCEVITDGGGNVTVRGDSLGCNGDMECPGSNEVCCQKSSVPETKPKTTTRCSDHADQGFQCVPSDQCSDLCEVITDGGGKVTVRGDSLGCNGDMECPGSNEVCCQRADMQDLVHKTNPEHDGGRLDKLESEVKGALERVKEALARDEVKVSEKAVSLLEQVRSTLESVLDKLSILMEQEGNVKVTVRGDSLGCINGMECPGDDEHNTFTHCSDHADQGFECVPSEECNEMCEIITDGSNLLDMRTQELGIDCSEKKCPGENQICCQRADMLDSVDITNPEYDGGRLEELESKVKGSLERVKEALEEVKGNEKAVSLLKNIHFTLESVLDKLSILMSQVPSQCLKGVFSLYKCLKS